MTTKTTACLTPGASITIDSRALVVHACLPVEESILAIAYWGLAAVYLLKDPTTGHILDAHLGQPSLLEEHTWPLWDFDRSALTEFDASTSYSGHVHLRTTTVIT